MCLLYDGNSRRLNRKWFYGEAGNRTCDPWFTRHGAYPLHHGGLSVYVGSGVLLLIVSTPDLCTLTYFYIIKSRAFHALFSLILRNSSLFNYISREFHAFRISNYHLERYQTPNGVHFGKIYIPKELFMRRIAWSGSPHLFYSAQEQCLQEANKNSSH